jgi:anti-sigma-K factor RskA
VPKQRNVQHNISPKARRAAFQIASVIFHFHKSKRTNKTEQTLDFVFETGRKINTKKQLWGFFRHWRYVAVAMPSLAMILHVTTYFFENFFEKRPFLRV